MTRDDLKGKNMARTAAVLVSLFLIAAVPEVASAQDGDPASVVDDAAATAKVKLARRLFNEGVEATRGSRWRTAHDKFKKSYELAPRVLTLFNLASAQYRTDRYVEAAESYTKFLAQTSDGRFEEFRNEARSQLTEIENRIGVLVITVNNLEGADKVAIDGVSYPHSAIGEELPVNPGNHQIVVRRDGATIATKTVSVARGGAERATIEIDRGAPPDLRVPPPREDGLADSGSGLVIDRGDDGRRDDGGDKGGSIFRSPWFWTAVAVVVGGGAAGYLLLSREADPTAGTLGGVVEVP